MKDYLTKLCMFLFLAALFSGRTNELGVLTGALTGTVLLLPLYRKFVPLRSENPKPSTPHSRSELSGRTPNQARGGEYGSTFTLTVPMPQKPE
jgi:hypothetical protein